MKSNDQKMTYPPLMVLKEVAEDVWIVDGPIIRFYGMPFPTRMTVIKLKSGGIWVHSPTGDDQKLMEEVANLGPVEALVAPNWIHYAWVPDWQKRFPEAKTWVAPGVVKRAESRGLSLGTCFALENEDPWSEEIRTRIIEGHRIHREAVFFHRPSKTLVLTDLIENFEKEKIPLWFRPLVWAAGTMDPDGRTPLDMRTAIKMGDIEAARRGIRELLSWEPERVLLAHGRWYEKNGAKELRRAFRWLGSLD